jgi:hypothetical protein
MMMRMRMRMRDEDEDEDEDEEDNENDQDGQIPGLSTLDLLGEDFKREFAALGSS